jgi:predicted anti-sigma-YlaC factor YlaD
MTNNVNVSNISCEEAIELIAMQLDKSAGDVERLVLERHLKTCRHCFDRLEFEKLLKNRLTKMKADVSSEQLERKIDALLSSFQ